MKKIKEDYPQKKKRELRREDKKEIHKRIREGDDNIYKLGKEFDYSPSQIAGVKGGLNRGKKGK